MSADQRSAIEDGDLEQATCAARAGDFVLATRLFGCAVERAPHDARALRGFGASLLALGSAGLAAASLERAAALRPDDCDILSLLGHAYLDCGRPSDALEVLERAHAMDQSNVPVMIARSLALERLDRCPEAMLVLGQVLKAEPGNAGALYNLGVLLLRGGRAADAARCLASAQRGRPAHVETLTTLGIARRRAGDLVGAIAVLQEAVRRAPRMATAWIALGNARYEALDLDAAERCFITAIDREPANGEASMHLGMLRLAQGRLREGWSLYERRPQAAAEAWAARQGLSAQRWDGRSLDGPLLLVCEQGIGDTIQFMRLARLATDRGIDCVLVCEPRLRWLAEGSRLFRRVVTPEDGVATLGPAAWCPLLSAANMLQLDEGTIPRTFPYLFADDARVRHWTAQLPATRGLRVGLAWQGNPAAEHDALRGRSFPLSAMEPLLSVADVTFVPLQLGYGREQLAEVSFGPALLIPPTAVDDGPDAFADTAAIIRGCDLVISSDTAVAHLAGALGCPVWIALSRVCDWRWQFGRADSPWYPTMRLFRQVTSGDWAGVFEEMRAELVRLSRGA